MAIPFRFACARTLIFEIKKRLRPADATFSSLFFTMLIAGKRSNLFLLVAPMRNKRIRLWVS